MRVELFHFEGCPLAPAAHRLVGQCLIALGIPDPVVIRVGDWASPTVLTNGIDVMRPAAELSTARVCRDRRADPGARAGRPASGPSG
jgi:hypothetical protein